MRRFKVFIFPIFLIMWMFTNNAFIGYIEEIYDMQASLVLSINVNYATDAAVETMRVKSSDLQIDYSDYESVTVVPEEALDVFASILVRGFGWSDTEENRTYVLNSYVKSFIVAGYDGYYVAEPRLVGEDGSHKLMFSMKWPYKYYTSEGFHALNMGATDTMRVWGEAGSLYRAEVQSPLSRKACLQEISRILSNALMESVYKQVDGNIKGSIYIPKEMTTINRTNAINGVSILAYVVPPDSFVGNPYYNSFSIGGSMFDHTEPVNAYTRADGTKCYCFQDETPLGQAVDRAYESAVDAAKAGYYYDMTLIK